jgi:hypothetical protein
MLDFNPTENSAAGVSVTLNALIEAAAHVIEAPRDYLGASAVGHPCARKIQYDWHYQVDHELRLREIFDRGHYFERRTRALLRRAKFRFAPKARLGFNALGGMFRGHADGILTGGPKLPGLGFPCLWEHKALNAKGWRAVNSKGLLEYPQYAAQVALYQGYLELTKHPAIFSVTNADTCERLHLLIPFDAALAQEVSDKALMIIEATKAGEILPRFTDDPANWKCRMCGHHRRCWDGAP